MSKKAVEEYGSGEVLGHGGKLDTGYETVEAVPAYYMTAGRDKFHPRGRDSGYILTLGSPHYQSGNSHPLSFMEYFLTVALCLCSLFLLSGEELTYPVVDTGVTDFYDNDSRVDKPDEGTPFFGQDAHYLDNQPSYTGGGKSDAGGLFGLAGSQRQGIPEPGRLYPLHANLPLCWHRSPFWRYHDL